VKNIAAVPEILSKTSGLNLIEAAGGKAVAQSSTFQRLFQLWIRTVNLVMNIRVCFRRMSMVFLNIGLHFQATSSSFCEVSSLTQTKPMQSTKQAYPPITMVVQMGENRNTVLCKCLNLAWA